MKYRKNQDVGLFDKENTLQELLENGNPLPKLKEIIDFERFLKDRTSFRDFLGIQSVDDVPDEKTVWKYKDTLAQNGTYDALFKRFNEYLDSIGLIVNEGKIIDASFVIAPPSPATLMKPICRRICRSRPR